MTVLLVSIALPSRAEPTAQDKAAAKNAYVAGMEFRSAGNNAAALEKFQAAYALLPTPITGLAVGRAQEELKKFVEARDAYVAVTKLPVKSTESPDSATAREQASKRAKDVAARIAHVTLKTEGLPADAETVVFVDDASHAGTATDESLEMNPGKHTLGVSAGARGKKTEEFVLSEGETRTVTIAFALPKKVDVPDKASVESGTRTNYLTYVGAGVAVVGVVGVIVALSSRESEVGKFNTCKGLRPQPNCSEYSDKADQNFVFSVAFGVVGLTGIVIGTAGLLSPVQIKPTSGSTAALKVGPNWLGVVGTF